MAHYGLLNEYPMGEATEEVRGATLYGLNDEKLGKIKDVIFDHATGDIRYVVVDTGGWLTSKEFLVPANRLQASSKHEDDFSCGLSKQQIENFPPYKKSDLESAEKWNDYEGKYRSKWESDPVMHRAGTDRNITPTTQQMEGNLSSLQAAGIAEKPVSTAGRGDREYVETTTDRIVPAGTDSVVIENSAVGIGGRWDTFQARLRERRKEAVEGCQTCTVGPASIRGSESADTLKKAV